MKYKNKVKRLAGFQAWYDKQDNKYKNAHKRPGSVKHI